MKTKLVHPTHKSNPITGGGGVDNHQALLKFFLQGSRNFIYPTAIFLSCFVLSFMATSLLTQPQPTKAVTGLSLVSTPTMALSTSTNTVALNITPTTTGTSTAGNHTLTATTNMPSGYSLAISTPTTPAFTTTTGTFAAPTALANNTWGYAVPGSGGFDASYASPTPSTTSKWANPSTSITIKNTSNSTSSLPTSATTTIYYAAKANTSKASGTYANTVRYTATANITNLPTPTITSITPNTGTTAGGTSITIVGTGFTVNDQSVTTAVTIDGTVCENISISSNTPTTGQDTITCTTPAHSAETVDVTVTTWGGTATKAGGYTYKLPAVPMQEVTMENCTTTRTLAYDVRDNATYWVQKMADGRCWMLTNLAYAGGTSNGGVNTYNDVKTINLNSTNTGATYTSPEYYIPPSSNKTINPADPSTSTDGGVTNPQYGYLYNWCAAMGVQPNTAACTQSGSPAPDASTSICPAGWRLPAGGLNREFVALNNAVNGGSTTSSAGLLSEWLGMYGGYWLNGFGDQGSDAAYWSSNAYAGVGAWDLLFDSSSVVPIGGNSTWHGVTVRCILDIPVQTGDYMQTVNSQNCPATRTRVRDARDDATYWIQKMADGRCWMLTNLAYGGGGTNTYGDVKSILSSTSDVNSRPRYASPPGANRTAGTTNPSTSTDGGATSPQYGYLYNWCAAMGGQTSTNACDYNNALAPDVSISICPTGWRLPTSSEFGALATAVGRLAGILSAWLATYSGNIHAGAPINQGDLGSYWSSTQYNTLNSYTLAFNVDGYFDRSEARENRDHTAVRCIAV